MSEQEALSSVAVYCGSSPGFDPAYAQAAASLGAAARRARDPARLRRRARRPDGRGVRRRPGRRGRGTRRHHPRAGGQGDRAPRPDQPRGRRDHARAQGRDGRQGRRVHHAARRLRHLRRVLRGRHLDPAGHPRQAMRRARRQGLLRPAARRCSTARSRRASSAPSTATCSSSTPDPAALLDRLAAWEPPSVQKWLGPAER